MSVLDALDVIRVRGAGLPRVQRPAAPDIVRRPRDVVDATGGCWPWLAATAATAATCATPRCERPVRALRAGTHPQLAGYCPHCRGRGYQGLSRGRCTVDDLAAYVGAGPRKPGRPARGAL